MAITYTGGDVPDAAAEEEDACKEWKNMYEVHEIKQQFDFICILEQSSV